jgi:hypothetical protein
MGSELTPRCVELGVDLYASLAQALHRSRPIHDERFREAFMKEINAFVACCQDDRRQWTIPAHLRW